MLHGICMRADLERLHVECDVHIDRLLAGRTFAVAAHSSTWRLAAIMRIGVGRMAADIDQAGAGYAGMREARLDHALLS